MGKAKEVHYYNDRYSGSLTDEACKALETIIEMNEHDEAVEDLRHCITDIDDHELNEFIHTVDSYGHTLYAPKLTQTVGTLRDYQTIGVAYLYWAGSCILGDSVGLGKTVITAGLINTIKTEYAKANRPFNCLVLTQKDLVYQIRAEMVKFTGDYYYLLKSSEQKEVELFTQKFPYEYRPDYNIVGTHNLLTSNLFIQWLEQSRTLGEGFPFDIVVIDESSVAGGNNTQIGNALKKLRKYITRLIFLNATPFESKLETFYNQLNIIDPLLLPTKDAFKKQYCEMDYRGMFPKPTGKYKNQERFKHLVAYRYLARTRVQKGAIMSDCSGRVVVSPLSALQKEWLKKTTMNRMIYDCPNHIEDSIVFCPENVPKLQSVLDLLNNECKDAETIIMFVYYREAQASLSEWLTNKGITNRVLNGAVSSADRNIIIDGFKRNEYKILITNVQKGLNFGNCNYCIFYSFVTNPASMIQFEGRITRSFDITGKNIYILCSEGEEYKILTNVLKERTKATADFTNTDMSVIVKILLEGFED